MQILRDASVKTGTNSKTVFFEAYRRKGVENPEVSANKAWRIYCANGQEECPDVVVDYCLDVLTTKEHHVALH